MKKMTLRLSAVQQEMLKKLSAKLQIREAEAIRMAISRLAEAEGIALSKRPRS